MTALRSASRWSSPRVLALGATALLVACLLAEQARGLLSFSQHYTDEDQTMLWLAGRDLLHGKLYTPNFWGQNYNTVFEALPGAVLHALGMGLSLASPLGAALIVVVCWLVVAAAAWRTDRLSAALALAIPVCLSVPFLVGFSQLAGRLTGDLFGALAVAAAVAIARPRVRLAAVLALGGLAVLWDNTNVLIIVPAVVFVLGEDWRALYSGLGRTVAWIVGGLLPPLAWFLYQKLWYHSHPGYVIDPSERTTLQASVLWNNIKQPQTLFAAYAPELLRHPRLAELLFVALDLIALGVSLLRRRIVPVLVAAVLTVVLLAIMSTTDTGTNSFAEVYLNGARFLFPLPLGAWLVLHATLRAGRRRDPATSSDVSGVPVAAAPARPWRRTAAGVVVALALASTISAQVTFNHQMAPLIAFSESPSSPVTVEDPASLLAGCRQVSAIYARYHADVLVTTDKPFTYGCAAEANINTLYPIYERRVWVLRTAAAKPVRRVLLQGYTCPTGASKVGNCVNVSDGLQLLRTPARPVVRTLAMLNDATRDA